MRPLVAHSHLGLAGTYAETSAEAAEHLEQARSLYREMGMGSWLAKPGTH